MPEAPVTAEPVQQAPDIVTKKASAELFGEVVYGQATRGEAGGVINYLDKMGPGAFDVLAGTKAPELQKTALTAIFGEKIPPQGDVLRPLYQTLAAKMTNLEKILNPNIEKTNPQVRIQLRAELRQLVQQTDGVREYFNALPDNNARNEWLNNILDNRIMQGDAIKSYTAAVAGVAPESSQYAVKSEQVRQIKDRIGKVEAEVKKLESTIGRKNIADIQAKQAILQSENTNLLTDRETLSGRFTEARQTMLQIRTTYAEQGVTGAALDTALRRDTFYREAEAETLQIKRILIPQIDRKIKNNQTELANNEKLTQASQRIDALNTSLNDLNTQLATAEGALASARDAVFKKITELSVTLDGILPQAAVAALNKRLAQINNAYKEKQITDAQKKAEEAKKRGDKLTEAQAQFEEALTSRFQEATTVRRWFKESEGIRIKIDDLRTEFFKAQDNPSKYVDYILNHQSGIEPDLLKYIKDNPDVKKEFVKKVKNTAYLNVSREGVQYLKLDSGTLLTLGKSSPFRDAATEAITADTTIRQIAEKLTGQKLDNRNAIDRAWNKLPVGGLLGLIMMLLGGLGTIVGGKKMVGMQ